MTMLPAGTVTFLMTDIEGSSARWEVDAPAMRAVIAEHDAIVTDVIDTHGGVVVKHLGDGCWAAFGSAPAAVRSAIEFQQQIQTGPWTLGERLKVRFGLHTGTTEPTEGDYFGPVPNRAARVADLANGDQIVCSTSTAHLLDGIDLRDLDLDVLRRNIGVVFIVCSDAFKATDGHGFFFNAAASAGGFTGSVASSAKNAWENIRFPVHHISFSIFPRGN